jgi:2-oxoglutarate ferredoxin oxidoreductase subunit alpha
MKKVVNKFTWKIGGEAGFGVNSSGLLFTKYFTRHGVFAFEYSEYPSLIRGGHQTSQITVDETPVYSEHFTVDLLLALNKASVELHVNELSKNSAIIYDSGQFTLSSPQELLGTKSAEVLLIGVPMTELAVNSANLNLLRNTVGLGASIALLGGELEILFKLVEEEFGHKDQSVIEMNFQAIQSGFDYVKEHYGGIVDAFMYKLETLNTDENRMVISGNEALGVGAIKGGVQFYAGYPMTPSSTLLGYMAAKQYDYNFVVKHAEDEIAVVNMTVGASFAGARAMCATSGGGFALMEEGIGLAAITETPLTIVNVQRPGPATGLPTWTDQGDLRFVIHASQGEFLRVVLAPGDMHECYVAIQMALNLAEKYQIPVIVLSDKWLAESHATVEIFNEEIPVERGKLILRSEDMKSSQKYADDHYARYITTNDGVSPRTVPGVEGGVFLANSDEHQENGYTSEESEVRIEQVDKRMLKLHHILKELPEPIIYGDSGSSILLVGWGSVKGPILEALKLVEHQIDTSVAFVHFVNIWPFPKEFVRETLSRYRKIILVENNSQGQLGGLIAQMSTIHIHDKWLKYDGRPFWPEELKQKIIDVIEMK